LTTGEVTIQKAGASSAVSVRGTVAADDTLSTTNNSSSAIAKAAAINDVSSQTGVRAIVNQSQIAGTATAGTIVGGALDGSNFITINDQKISGFTVQQNDADGSLVDAINAVSSKTGVVASLNENSRLVLTAADGRNITLDADEAGGGGDLNNFGLEATASGTTTEATTHYSTVTLSSASEITIASGNNGRGELDNTGFTEGSYGGGEDGQFLKDVDISTFEGAQSALTAIDNALGEISSQRADLGAVQNRFESTMDNLAITTENLSAANSRIKDADFAKETAEMSRTQVLQQAGISILAQANQKGQSVLSLLG